MKISDIQLRQAFAPKSRASADTQYNGTATLANAVGIPIRNADRSIFQLGMGDISASVTSIAYSIHSSSLPTGNIESNLTALASAVATITPANANSIVAGSVEHKSIVIPDADKSKPQYLFVKRVQTGAYAALDSVNVLQSEHTSQPQAIVPSGTFAFDV